MTKTQPTTAPTPAESAPQSAPAQGETPHEVACRLLNESDPNNVDKWREVNAVEAIITPLVRELNEAKTLYAAALDTLKDMSAQVAQLTGAQDRMDAEIAMLTADLFRATSERDQARQDLEERCAENDRERAAHLQAYQEACKERDEARAELPKEAFASNVAILELQSKLTAAESDIAELRKDRDEQEPYARFGKEILDQAKLACAEGLIGEEHEHRLELAAKLGAGGVRREPYDPNVHQAIDCEPGDLIWSWSPLDAARNQQENRE